MLHDNIATVFGFSGLMFSDVARALCHSITYGFEVYGFQGFGSGVLSIHDFLFGLWFLFEGFSFGVVSPYRRWQLQKLLSSKSLAWLRSPHRRWLLSSKSSLVYKGL